MDNQRQIKTRMGIVGIERNIEERNRATDVTISQAFQDMQVLMSKAKEMVNLSTSISKMIKEKQGEISEDETVQFKSYLMSLGIDDPVTRDNFKSSSEYYSSLANEICGIVLDAVIESGGQMTLPNVFCRVNRARGLDLVSPDDVRRACKQMENLRLPLKLHSLQSGVLVLQLVSMDDESLAKQTADLVKKKGSLAAVDFASECKLPVSAALERLQVAERAGLLVRDDSSMGVFYYWNLFLYPDEDIIIPYLS